MLVQNSGIEPEAVDLVGTTIINLVHTLVRARSGAHTGCELFELSQISWRQTGIRSEIVPCSDVGAMGYGQKKRKMWLPECRTTMT
jgi:hypothetical protein